MLIPQKQAPTRRTLLAYSLLALVGCVAPAPPSPEFLNVAVGTLQDTVVIQRTPDSTYFNVTAVALNFDQLPVEVHSCFAALQVEIDYSWRTVFVRNCRASDRARVFAGDSLVVPVEVVGYANPYAFPQWDPKMGPGNYRLLFGIGPGDTRGLTGEPPTQIQASTTFVVK
jgi:hypothetical protein